MKRLRDANGELERSLKRMGAPRLEVQRTCARFMGTSFKDPSPWGRAVGGFFTRVDWQPGQDPPAMITNALQATVRKLEERMVLERCLFVRYAGVRILNGAILENEAPACFEHNLMLTLETISYTGNQRRVAEINFGALANIVHRHCHCSDDEIVSTLATWLSGQLREDVEIMLQTHVELRRELCDAAKRSAKAFADKTGAKWTCQLMGQVQRDRQGGGGGVIAAINSWEPCPLMKEPSWAKVVMAFQWSLNASPKPENVVHVQIREVRKKGVKTPPHFKLLSDVSDAMPRLIETSQKLARRKVQARLGLKLTLLGEPADSINVRRATAHAAPGCRAIVGDGEKRAEYLIGARTGFVWRCVPMCVLDRTPSVLTPDMLAQLPVPAGTAVQLCNESGLRADIANAMVAWAHAQNVLRSASSENKAWELFDPEPWHWRCRFGNFRQTEIWFAWSWWGLRRREHMLQRVRLDNLIDRKCLALPREWKTENAALARWRPSAMSPSDASAASGGPVGVFVPIGSLTDARLRRQPQRSAEVDAASASSSEEPDVS